MLTAKPRRDLTAHWALWIIARDMATDAPFPVGYWTGDDATTLTVPGAGARTYYGAGVRYTQIFAANNDQIRDPNLIYPGQIFNIPEE